MIMKWDDRHVKAHSKCVFLIMTWGDSKDDEPMSNPCILELKVILWWNFYTIQILNLSCIISNGKLMKILKYNRNI